MNSRSQETGNSPLPAEGEGAKAPSPGFVGNFANTPSDRYDSDALRVSSSLPRLSTVTRATLIPGTVNLCMDAGALSFQHSMTPAQAIELASLLVQHANYLNSLPKVAA